MNVLVIVADTFRADYLGCAGNDWIHTPNLDALAADGVRFSEFYAEGLPTLPVRRVFYTGRTVFPFLYIPQKSDTVNLPGWHPLFDEDITMAEWLRDRGYTTGLISDVYHQMKPGKNFHRGFHSWQWIRGQENDPLVPTPQGDRDISDFTRAENLDDPRFHRLMSQYLNNRSWWQSGEDHYAAQVMKAAADWITNYGHKGPWMLWVESFDPHEPWNPPKADADRYAPGYEGIEPIWARGSVDDYTEEQFQRIKALYAGEVTHVDRWCGHVFQALKGLNMWDDTIVVFTSDHGCMMGEQGQIHKGVNRIRHQVARCPLIVRHPDPSYAGTVVDGFVQHQDLMPTLLNLLDQPVPDRCDGENAWPLVTGEQEGDLRDTLILGFGWYASVRTHAWSYQAAWANPQGVEQHPPELYQLTEDPEEVDNVIADYPAVAQEMQEILDAHLEEKGRPEGPIIDTDTPAAIPGLKW
jgi:arylsulfatase A-like enzyme